VYPFGEAIRTRNESHFRLLAFRKGEWTTEVRQVVTRGCSLEIYSSLMFRASYAAQKCIARGLLFLGSDNVTLFFSSKAAAAGVQQKFPSTGEEFIGARSHKVGVPHCVMPPSNRVRGYVVTARNAETPPTWYMIPFLAHDHLLAAGRPKPTLINRRRVGGCGLWSCGAH
jgi:hypothetical protein